MAATDENNIMIRERLTALESSCGTLQKRVDHVELLVESVQKMTVEMQHMREDLNRMAAELTDMENKPAKRWETIVSALLGALAGGLGTMLLSVISGG